MCFWMTIFKAVTMEQRTTINNAEAPMKKSIRNIIIGLLIIIALIMVLSLSACSNNKNDIEPKSLYAQGLEIVQIMS